MTEGIVSGQFHTTQGAEAWRVLPEGGSGFFQTESFATTARFVEAISALVRDGNPPDIDIRWDGVTVLIRAFKGRDFGLVQGDLDLALTISASAHDMGLIPEPRAIQSLSIIPGATDRRRIMPLWQAVLAYDPRPDSPDEDLVDPHGRLAPFWFEEINEPRADGAGTMHLVVWVPWDEAESRVAAAVAASGRIIRHNQEEGFWTLGDPAGNEVDIATTYAPERTE